MNLGMEQRISGVLHAAQAVWAARAELLRRFAEIWNSGELAGAGYGSAQRAFREWACATPRDATIALQQISALFPQPGITGVPIESPIPTLRDAFLAGEISDRHVTTAVKLLEKLPAEVVAEQWADIEKKLAAEAMDYSPNAFDKYCNVMHQLLCPDGDEPDYDASKERDKNHLDCKWTEKRGVKRLKVDGDLDLVTGEKLLTALGPLAKPLPKDDNGDPDPRSIQQRQADALDEMLDRCMTSGELPEVNGEAVSLYVTVAEDKLRKNIGHGLLDNGNRVPVNELRRMACDCHVLPVVLGSQSQPIDIGEKTRIAPNTLRRALAVRDKGCAHPNCHRKASHTQVHHVRHWLDGGVTILENTVLLCRYHHQLIHDTDWTVHIGHDGTPVFTPPHYLRRRLRT